MVPQKTRKQKVDVIFPLMDLLIQAGPKGLVADTYLAKRNNWTDSGLSLALKALIEKGVVICTEVGCKNKRVALPQDIESHSDWLLRFYGGKIPPRYEEYIMIPEREKGISKRNLSSLVRGIFGKNDPLRKRLEDFLRESREIEKILLQMVSEMEKEIERIKKIQPKVGLG